MRTLVLRHTIPSARARRRSTVHRLCSTCRRRRDGLFTFVQTDTTTQAPDFDYPYWLSFFDVDGDLVDDGTGTDQPFYELVSFLEATEA